MTIKEFRELKVNDMLSNEVMEGRHIIGRSYRVFGREKDELILKDLKTLKIVRMTLEQINNSKNPIHPIGKGYDEVVPTDPRI